MGRKYLELQTLLANKQLKRFNIILYFIVEIIMSFVLTLLPIKIVYNRLLVPVQHLYTVFDVVVFLMCLSHLYLYLVYKLEKTMKNPLNQTKLLMGDRRIKIRWRRVVSTELIYDVLCIGVAIYQVTQLRDSTIDRIIEIIYLPKIYKIRIFHDRIKNTIIGTPFYIPYNIIFGIFIFIILVTYAGCLFYQIDYLLATNNYFFSSLLWINDSAWNGIINSDLGIQLLYPIYWSVGTASSAAYGNISATAPPDVLYDILCIYFQGFLFGFYINRLYYSADSIGQQQKQLLELYERFDDHNNQLVSVGEGVEKDLYLKILCSIDHHRHNKQDLEKMKSILTQDLMVQIREEVYDQLLCLNPFGIWREQCVKREVSLNLKQILVEKGQNLFQYSSLHHDDFLFLKQGAVFNYLEVDHMGLFPQRVEEGQAFNVFNLITGLNFAPYQSQLTRYSLLYYIDRRQLKKCFNTEASLHFNSLFFTVFDFDFSIVKEPIVAYGKNLSQKDSFVQFMNPSRQSSFVITLLNKQKQSNKQIRNSYCRKSLHQKKVNMMEDKKSIGVQYENINIIQVDSHHIFSL